MTTELLNTITSGFTGIQSDVLQALIVVVPIALVLFGVIFAWKIGTRFFRNLAGDSRYDHRINGDDYTDMGDRDFDDDDED